MRRVSFFSWLVLIATLLLWGCDEGNAPAALDLQVERESWDAINATWEVKKGDLVLVDAQAVLYNANYDTLYAGDGTSIDVPDYELGNNEHLLIEVCGQINGEDICAQEGIMASPKRIATNYVDIRYPVEPSYTRGQFRAEVRVERQVYGNEQEWEMLDVTHSPELFLVASVGQSATPVILQHQSRSHEFNLSQHRDYGEFAYELRSAMYGNNSAEVYLQVRAEWNGLTEKIAEEQHRVSEPSEQERQDDIHFFAQQAANQVIQELFGTDDSVSDAQVQVERWEYNRFDDKYAAELEIRWREQQRRGRAITHTLRGRLTATQSGTGASFTAERATRHARDAWRTRVTNSSSLNLASLRTNLKRQAMESTDEQTAADSLLPAIAHN